MGNIIVATPKIDDAVRIRERLRSAGLPAYRVCSLGSEVLQAVHEDGGGVLVMTAKLPDIGYLELSEYIPDTYEMLLLTRDPSLVTESDHIMKLLLPYKVSDLVNTVEMLLYQEERRIKKKKPPKKRTAEDQSIIDKAKKILMERNEMTEPESYRYLQKCSMDSGNSLREAAEMVIIMDCYR